MRNFLKTIQLLFFVLLASASFAQTANLSIQGILRTAEGDAVEDGDYEIRFRLYTQPNTGNHIWEEEIEEVEVKGGIYSVVLGTNTIEYPLNVPFDQVYYLGVSVEGGIELNPRARLTSSPYALSLIGDDNIFPNSGNVGVGAASPQHKLTVQRGDGFLGLEAIEDANNTATITTTAEGMQLDAGGTDKIYSFNNGRIAATADEQFTVEGTDTAQLVFTNSNGNATLGFDATNGDDLQLSNAIGATKIEGNQIVLNATNAPVEINSNGESLQLIGTDSSFIGFYPEGKAAGRKLHIGFSDPSSTDVKVINNYTDGRIIFKSQILAQGTRVENLSNYYRYSSNGVTNNPGNGETHMGLVASHTKAVTYYTNSDVRIKKDFQPSIGAEDLLTLNKIKVTDYKHKDVVKHGTAYKKGLLAQQVLEVFPEAVTKSPDLIPSIYEFPTAIKVEDGTATFQLPTPHGLAVGEVVKMIFDKEEERFIVSAINSPKSFSIENWEATQNAKNVFVFGKEVDDFHTVDYDRVFTLNVSATQELARQVEVLKKENAALKTKSTHAEQANIELKAEVKDINQRLKSLESLMHATGQK